MKVAIIRPDMLYTRYYLMDGKGGFMFAINMRVRLVVRICAAKALTQQLANL
ncbi:hypothetical protein ES708_29033 [subsurface metagenome]